MKILAINPGSTSTKLAIYEDREPIFIEKLDHPIEIIQKYNKVVEQFDFRKKVILDCLNKNSIDLNSLTAIVGRGGILPPVKSGAYIVNKTMIDRLRNNPILDHASNLGAIISYDIASSLGISAYIYDSVAVDEMFDEARLSGTPMIDRRSLSHSLNSRAMAHKVAEKYGKKYNQMNFVIAHLGGGISVGAHQKGRIVDVVSDDEGAFSPERAGRVPCYKLVDLCYSGEYSKEEVKKMLIGKGGIRAYLETLDAKEVEQRIESGDKYAKLVYESMAYQIAKSIGELSTVLKGDIDAIIITGGIAYSYFITSRVVERVKFIAPVEIMAGENELESLVYGVLRVLNGEEKARIYTEL